MSSLRFELVDEVACANQLGEAVQWNHRDQSVWWADIKAQRLFRYELASKQLEQWLMPEPLACFAFVENDSRLLLALASGLAWFEKTTGSFEWIARPEAGVQGNRLNDGRVDRQGRFWVGSMVEERHSPDQSASLFCLDAQQRVTHHLTGLRISNSLCWSLDSSLMYHADSPSRQIWVYDFDATAGAVGRGTLFSELPDGAYPDGSCVDAEGFVWNAQWGAGQVVRYSSAGRIDGRIALPVSQPTCVAFGGANLDLLLVTSAWIGLHNPEPRAGNLFIYRVNTCGVNECWYRRELPSAPHSAN